MTRSTVYQLRLHPDEKAWLAQEAQTRGVSIARLIRDALGGLEGHPLEKSAAPPELDQDRDVREAAAFELRVAAKSRLMPLAAAERVVRAEMRSESQAPESPRLAR